jgi:hypothetical protein
MDGEEKIIAEKKTRSDFTGLCLDLKDRFRAEALKADSQEVCFAYTNDQAEFSDLWARTLIDVQGTLNHFVRDPFRDCSNFQDFELKLQDVLDEIRTETRLKLKDRSFDSYGVLAEFDNFGFSCLLQDYILGILDGTFRAVRSLDQVVTCSQVFNASEDDAYKIVFSARFVKEYNFMFNVKWRLRADKFVLGITIGCPETDDLWEPVHCRNFDEWSGMYTYDDEDRLTAIEECFSGALANTPEMADRPNFGNWPKLDHAKWLEANMKARKEKMILSPLGQLREVPRQLYVDRWRTRLTPRSGDDLEEYRGKNRLVVGDFAYKSERKFVEGVITLTEEQVNVIEDTAITWLRHGIQHAARAASLTYDKLGRVHLHDLAEKFQDGIGYQLDLKLGPDQTLERSRLRSQRGSVDPRPSFHYDLEPN